jgi:hypothetical protein
MAEWKKVVVSGSAISQLNNDAGYLTAATVPGVNTFATMSINGVSVIADSGADTLTFASASGAGLNIVGDAGADSITFTLGAIPNASLANSTISGVALGGTLAALTAGSGLESAGTYTGNTARTFAVATGSTHFVEGARKTISVSDTTGASGIDLTYNSSTGVLSGVLQNSSLTVTAGSGLSGGGSVNLGGTTTVTLDTGSAHFLSGSRKSISLTTTGNSGASTYTNTTGVLNVPTYTLAGLGGVATTRQIIAGTGLTGGGDLSADRTLALTGQALALHNLASPGVIARTGAGTVEARTITGTTNQITVTNGDGVSGNPTISLPSNVTISNNLTVTGDLFVNGTTTQINTADLYVEDKFIVLASGSANAGDGGIIIDRGSDAQGNIAFGYDSATDRWGYQNGLSDTSNVIDPTGANGAFAGYVFTEAAHTSTKPTSGEFVQAGAIYTNTDGTIWMYA